MDRYTDPIERLAGMSMVIAADIERSATKSKRTSEIDPLVAYV
jgi:hypothetical protein